MENDQVYFTRRAAEERLAAMRSANTVVREAHLEMARRYDERIVALSEVRHIEVTSAA